MYITLVWLFSGVLCLPPLLGWAEYRFIAGQSQCFVNWPSSASYTFSMVGVCLFGPASVMAFSYWKIWKLSDASDKKHSSAGRRFNGHSGATKSPSWNTRENAKTFEKLNTKFLKVHPYLIAECAKVSLPT